MSIAPFSSPLSAQIERLLTGLAGVVSARAVIDGAGEIEEIHILATAALHPKQVVRNIESALTAGLGLDIDRRMISVAQMRGDPPAPAGGDAPEAAEADREPAGGPMGPEAGQLPDRLIFVGYDAHTDSKGQTVCTVVLERGRERFSGSGDGPGTVPGRAASAARAVFQALEGALGKDDLALEGAAVVDAHGRSYILVGARGLEGRNTVALTGIAPITRSPEEAAILASLQATNRWTELPA